MIGTFVLVVDTIPHLPVVAPDGIIEGRGLVAAALALGASGVLTGTRFIVAKENGLFSAYHDEMFSSTEADTITTHLPTRRPARSIRNQYIEKYLESGTKPLAWDFKV